MKSSYAVWLFVILLPSAAWSQASSSTVRGTVRDQVQAVIPTAKVTLVNNRDGQIARRSSRGRNLVALCRQPLLVRGKASRRNVPRACRRLLLGDNKRGTRRAAQSMRSSCHVRASAILQVVRA